MTPAQELVLAAATELARSGRYGQAERVLADGDATGVEALDLRARIRAQQGDTTEALALWAGAATQTGDEHAFAAERARAAEGRGLRGGSWLAWVIAGLLLLASVGIVAALLLDVRRSTDATRDAVEDGPPPASATTAPPASTTIPVTPAAEQLADVSRSLAGVAGITVVPGEERVVVRFDEGLFARDTDLRPDGAATLRALGEALAAHEGTVTVTVVGHTDADPISSESAYGSNEALGLARASTAVQRLRDTSTLGQAAFRLGTAGSADAPYPNDNRSDRARNRTVVVEISPAGTDA